MRDRGDDDALQIIQNLLPKMKSVSYMRCVFTPDSAH